MCDHEAKELIREQIRTNSNPALPFPTYSPRVFNKDQQILSSTESIRDEIFMHIAAPYLLKKLNITSLNDVDCYLRKQMLTTLSSPMLIWLSKSFTNFSGTAHQLCRQGLVTTDQCRMCHTEREDDMLHALFCSHSVFQNYKNEVISLLQIKLLSLLDKDMLPLCLLEWMLDDECEVIDEIPTEAMTALKMIGKRGVWFGFLPTLFTKWVRWKYDSTKWLVTFMRLCIESLHDLWMERCRIVHESLASKILVEDHHHLLTQVQVLFNNTEIESSSVLQQYRHRLHRLPTETLRGVAYQLLSDLNIDSHDTPFHNDIKKNCKSPWRDLTPEVLIRRDQATIQRHHRTRDNKRRREEFDDMVESKLPSTRRRI